MINDPFIFKKSKHARQSKVKQPKITDRGVPECFNSQKQWDNWRSYWRSCGKNEKTETPNYCEDCLPEYQYQMIREFRCAYPGTTFDIDDDGFVCGVRPVRVPVRDLIRVPSRSKSYAQKRNGRLLQDSDPDNTSAYEDYMTREQDEAAQILDQHLRRFGKPSGDA
jgi:hypothetical protein